MGRIEDLKERVGRSFRNVDSGAIIREVPKSIKTLKQLLALVAILAGLVPISTVAGMAAIGAELTVFHVVVILGSVITLVTLVFGYIWILRRHLEKEMTIDVSESLYGLTFEEVTSETENDVEVFRTNETLQRDVREAGKLERLFRAWYSSVLFAACAVSGRFDPSVNSSLMEWDKEKHSITVHGVNGFYLRNRVLREFKIGENAETTEGVCGEALIERRIIYQPTMEDRVLVRYEGRYLKSMMSIPIPPQTQKIEDLKSGEVVVLNIGTARKGYFTSNEALDRRGRHLQRLLRKINKLRCDMGLV